MGEDSESGLGCISILAIFLVMAVLLLYLHRTSYPTTSINKNGELEFDDTSDKIRSILQGERFWKQELKVMKRSYNKKVKSLTIILELLYNEKTYERNETERDYSELTEFEKIQIARDSLDKIESSLLAKQAINVYEERLTEESHKYSQIKPLLELKLKETIPWYITPILLLLVIFSIWIYSRFR